MPAKPKKTQKPIPTKVDLNTMPAEDILALVQQVGGQRAFGRKYKIPRTTLQKHLYKLRVDPYTHRPAPEAIHIAHQPASGTQYFILTSAQDSTKVHDKFLANLVAYRDWLKQSGSAEIMIGGFTYSKKLFTDRNPKGSWYADQLRPFMVHDRMRIADKIDFCGEMNTLPTATQPLSGFETYTRERWGIFPHAKVQLKSVPTMKHEPAKMIMTTGAVTMPNYLPMKAGIKASFHHIFGAVLVEVAPDGAFFCRHLLADSETGDFYDLDRLVKRGAVTVGHAITAMTPGDIHTAQIDPVASKALFGMFPLERDSSGKRTWELIVDPERPNMLDALRPAHVTAHDLLDWRYRNHHSINDPYDRFALYINGTESCEDEVGEVAMFSHHLTERRPWLQMHVVDSNHDQAMSKFLKTADHKTDPVNALFILRCELLTYEAIKRGDKRFSIFETVIKTGFPAWPCDRVHFMREDDSFRIGGVEHGNHGHRGLNGARGSTQAYAKIGPRVTIGHQHTCGILDGVYVAGTTSKLDLGYNVGPSSWSHTTVIQYANGKRALVTLSNGRWCA